MYISPFLNKGWGITTMDAKAHGKSDGKQIILPDYVAMIETLERTFGKFNAYLAHSFGGIAVSLHLEKNSNPNANLVLIAPATETDTAINLFSKIIGLGENVRNIIDNNPVFQHIITFTLIFFIIVLLNKTPPSVPLQALYSIIDSPNNNLLYLFGVSILIYILFIISSRTPLMFTGLILILLFLLFVFNSMALKKKKEKNEEEYKKYKLMNVILKPMNIVQKSCLEYKL